jgi:hypothetical protein
MTMAEIRMDAPYCSAPHPYLVYTIQSDTHDRIKSTTIVSQTDVCVLSKHQKPPLSTAVCAHDVPNPYIPTLATSHVHR